MIDHATLITEAVAELALPTNPLLEAALRYAARGWRVHPVHGVVDGRCTCGHPACANAGKHPASPHGLKDATTDEAQIRAWWTERPTANVAIATGAASGLWVLDVDGEDGARALRELHTKHGDEKLPTLTARSGGGGQHLYFRRHPGEGITIRTSAGKLGPGLDVRGDGGSIVAAPSMHQSGQTYRWVNSGVPIADAPTWLLDLAIREAGPAAAAVTDGNVVAFPTRCSSDRPGTPYGHATLQAECRAVREAPDGAQQSTLNTAAFKLGQLVAGGHLDHGQARDALVEAGCAMPSFDPARPWRREQIETTVDHGLTDGARSPRVAPVPVPEDPGQDGRDRDTVEALVDEINREHGLVLVGGKMEVLRETRSERGLPEIRLLSFGALKALYENRRVRHEGKSANPAELWLRSPRRRQYEGLTFAPGGEAPSGYYNLFRGFAVEPRPGDCTLFLDHLLQNVCHGDPQLYDWVIAWFAYLVQRPGEKPGTALVLRGAKGCGKSVVGKVIGSLLGSSHHVVASCARHVTGHFNGHLAACLLLQVEEGIWAGDKAAEGALKHLITGEEQLIERKGREAVSTRNVTRVLITSNESWVVPASGEERRYAVLDVGDGRRQDHSYFAVLDAQMKAGGREALLHHLLNVDLSTVNLRRPPVTPALIEQKLLGLDGIEAWWLDCLRRGHIVPLTPDWEHEVECQCVYDCYVQHARTVGTRRRAIEVQVGQALRKLVPGVKRERVTAPASGRPYAYRLPPLEDCRKAFEGYIGGPIDW